VVLPVALGAAVYVLWRDRGLLVFSWLEAVGATGVVDLVRTAARSLAVPDSVRFCLPDGLWAYALAYALAHVWADGRPRERRIWFGVCCLASMGPELGQAAGLVPGTFDPADLTVSALGFLIGWQHAVGASAGALVAREGTRR